MPQYKPDTIDDVHVSLFQMPHTDSQITAKGQKAALTASHFVGIVPKRRGGGMVSAREFREYADECMRSAKTVRSDKELKALLRMAEAWLEAADLLERPLKTDSARSVGPQWPTDDPGFVRRFGR